MANMFNVMPEELVEYCSGIFRGFGVPAEDANVAAGSLVDADLRGVVSHGVVRVSNYIDRLREGGANPKPSCKILRETPLSAVIDADNSLGSIAAEKAVQTAREKAEKSGFAIVAVKNSNHYGTAAHWSLKLSGDDMIGISCSNVEPLMAVTGGITKAMGNNPISFAFPTEKYGNICYDVACSKMAGGNIFKYKLMGMPLPDESFLDAKGEFTTDPDSASCMIPFGAHKGYGLAVVVEMLTSILAGESFGPEMGSQYFSLGTPNLISHCFIAIRVDMLREATDYRRDADRFVEYLHSLPTANGSSVFFPGEIEQANREKNLKQGIMLAENLVTELRGFARKAGVGESCDAVFRAV